MPTSVRYSLDGPTRDSQIANPMSVSPSPRGYAVPQSIRRQSISDDVPDAPYDELGCAADFNQDGKLDPDDLSDFIAAYFAGC